MERAATMQQGASVQTMLRPGRVGDLGALGALAGRGGSGLTNLPPDRAALGAKLAASEAAIADADVRETGAAIMLVVESAGEAVGTGADFKLARGGITSYGHVARHLAHTLGLTEGDAMLVAAL